METSLYLIENHKGRQKLIDQIISAFNARRTRLTLKDGFGGKTAIAYKTPELIAQALSDTSGVILLDLHLPDADCGDELLSRFSKQLPSIKDTVDKVWKGDFGRQPQYHVSLVIAAVARARDLRLIVVSTQPLIEETSSSPAAIVVEKFKFPYAPLPTEKKVDTKAGPGPSAPPLVEIDKLVMAIEEQLFRTDESGGSFPDPKYFSAAPNYLTVTFKGKIYRFNDKQATGVKILHQAYRVQPPGLVTTEEFFDALARAGKLYGAPEKRSLKDLYRNCDAWGVLIVWEGHGKYRLAFN